jgi:hypothetical protein
VCSHSPGRVGLPSRDRTKQFFLRRLDSKSIQRPQRHECHGSRRSCTSTHKRSKQTLIINSRPCAQLLCRCSCCAYNIRIVLVHPSLHPSPWDPTTDDHGGKNSASTWFELRKAFFSKRAAVSMTQCVCVSLFLAFRSS